MDAGSIAVISCFTCSGFCTLLGIHICRQMNAPEPQPVVIPNVSSSENLCSMCKSQSCENLVAEELPYETQ